MCLCLRGEISKCVLVGDWGRSVLGWGAAGGVVCTNTNADDAHSCDPSVVLARKDLERGSECNDHITTQFLRSVLVSSAPGFTDSQQQQQQIISDAFVSIPGAAQPNSGAEQATIHLQHTSASSRTQVSASAATQVCVGK